MRGEPSKRGRHMVRPMVLLALCLLFIPCSSSGSVAGKVRKGNKEYRAENYPDALKEYTDAQLEAPESEILHYNVANAHYKQQDWESALAEYGKTLSGEERQLAAQAFYNMGNTLYRQGKLPEAIDAYKSALKLDPGDTDAKYNLEFVQKMMEKQQQQQSQDQSSEGDQQEQEQQQQQDQEQKQGDQKEQQQQQQQEEEQEQAQQQQEQEATENQEGEEQQPPPRKPGQMSEEEAVQLLNALQEQEKKAQEERQEAQRIDGRGSEWDW